MAPRKRRKTAPGWEKTYYGMGKSRGHDKVFWNKAWKLYAKYGIPLEYAKKREWSYMAGAKKAYYRVQPYKKTAS